MKPPESFKDHPVSLAEIRSTKSERASDWTPRDCLIAMLRRIDSGETNPEALVICFRELPKDKGSAGTNYSCASPDPHITLGLLTRVTQIILSADE